MSFKERLRLGRKEYEPSPLGNRILSVGLQWKMEGVPLWTGTAMAFELEKTEEKVLAGKLSRELRSLEKHGALFGQWGLGVKDKPVSRLVQRDELVDGIGVGRFYQVTAEGQNLRKPIISTDKSQVASQHTREVPNS